ncbi:MAG TPA: carboxypeptidase-like regulatory domain-containing protein, partial [Pyrinomonadaceae bacterium]
MVISRRSCSRLLSSIFAVLLLVGLAGSAVAQSITGSISGTVTDATGGVVVGASVTLHSDQTGTARSATTSDDGRFSFAALQPGVYTVKVEQRGFQTLERKNAVLSANESLALEDLALTAGQVSETVTVTGEGAMVEKESSDLTARLTADQISLI